MNDCSTPGCTRSEGHAGACNNPTIADLEAAESLAQDAGYNRGWIDGKRAAEFQIDPRVEGLELELDALRVAGLMICAAIAGLAYAMLNRKEHNVVS